MAPNKKQSEQTVSMTPNHNVSNIFYPAPIILMLTFWVVRLLLPAGSVSLAPDGMTVGLFGLLLICAFGIKSTPSRWLRVIGHCVMILIVASIGLDTLLRFSINSPLHFEDLIKYGGEWQAISSFVGWQHILVIAVILVTWNWTTRYKFPARLWQTSGLFMLGLGLLITMTSTSSGRTVIQDLTKLKLRSEANFYSDQNAAILSQDWRHKQQLLLPRGARTIVLLIAESLSAEDSYRTSGLGNRLKKFDEISEHGIMFTNFMANYADTEGGLVSLLSGFPPVPYPGGNRKLYRSFEHGMSVIDQFNEEGFETEFLTTGPLTFLRKGDYLEKIGYQKIQGLHETEAFREAPKFSFKSPPDEYLYEEALRKLDSRGESRQPYLLTLLTVTGHRPMKDPDGRKNSQDNVWEYIDRQYYRFFQELSSRDFFNDGILIITSDHRKMYPLTQPARDFYLDTAPARIPLVIVGSGIPRNRIDHRLFQQSDLLRQLGLVPTGKQLTQVATYVERYTLHYTKSSAYGKLRVIDSGQAVFPARVFGNQLEWLGAQPAVAKEYELSLHSQRSEHQLNRLSAEQTWKPWFDSEGAQESSKLNPGLRLELYEGTDINYLLTSASPRYIQQQIIENVSFPRLDELISNVSRHYSLRITGKLDCPSEGYYWFQLESDDGAGLAIDETVVVDANYPKAYSPEHGVVALAAGLHDIELRYFQRSGPAGLRLSWKRPGDDDWSVIPQSYLQYSE